MKQFGQKIRLIFIPFLIISAGSVVAYSLLRWLLFIKSNAATVDEDILDFWAPWAFVWIPILIWLRPRFKLLNLSTKNNRGDPLFGLMMCASIGMAIPVIVAQFYLQAETGKLTKLDNISQIDSIPKTKYYSVKHYYADKKLVRFKTRFKVSGRYSSDYDMYIYAVVPVYDLNHTTKTYNYKIGAKGSPITSDNALIVLNNKIVQKEDLYKINPHAIKNIILLNGNSAMHRYGSRAKNGAIQIETKPFNGPDTMQVIHDDNLKHTPFAWLGVKYQKTIRNRLSSSEKDERFKHFAKKSEADFKSKSFDNFVYLDRVSYSTDLKQYTAATNLPNYQAVATSLNILTPNYDSFDKRMGDTLPWIFGAFGIGSLFVMLMLLLKPLRGDVVQEMDSRDSTQQIIDDITGKK